MVRESKEVVSVTQFNVSFFCSGVHHNSINCDSSQLISKVQFMIANAAKVGHLYPKSLKLSKIIDEEEVVDTLKPNGGWSDLRDILLCLNMTLGSR